MADLFFGLGIHHYCCAVSIWKCLTFPIKLLSGCQWGSSTAKGIVVSLCTASCCGFDEQRMCCAPAFFFLLLNYKNFSRHLALQRFILSPFFSCSKLKVRCKVIVSKDTKIWHETGHFRSSRKTCHCALPVQLGWFSTGANLTDLNNSTPYSFSFSINFTCVSLP